MFEKIKTPRGGIIILEFEDEPTEESFRNYFKNEENFLKTLPDEIKETSKEITLKISNQKNIGVSLTEILIMSLIDSMFTIPMEKFSGPTEEQFDLYMQDIDTVIEIQENNEDNCLICLNPNCPFRHESFDEDLYKKAVNSLRN